VACAEAPSHSRGPGNISVRVRLRVSFTTGAVRSAILATAELLVLYFGTAQSLMVLDAVILSKHFPVRDMQLL